MFHFSEIIIYYFSGTGNSANVARWISELANKQAISVKIKNIAHIDRLNIESHSENSLIVFTSPVHGFNYPPVMLNFILRFPKGKCKILLMNTRAGMLIGKWITPGLSGITFYLSALILKLKGHAITGMIPIDMPSNWISVHPGLNNKTIEYLHVKNKIRVQKHITKILSGKNNFIAVREIIQDLLISPISLGYYFVGRFIISKTYFASSDCNQCGLCIKSCPVNAIKEVQSRPYWTFRCESCMHCMSYCPKKAIETAHGFVVAIILIYSILLLPFIYVHLNSELFFIKNEFIRFLFESSIFLILIWLSYYILHFLLRFKLFERFIVYTSLTKFKFWGKRYRALNI